MAEARRDARPPRRARGRDPLGLRRAVSGGLLPGVTAAMALLAALGLAGAEGAAAVAARWEAGAAAAVTAQLPDAAPERLARAAALLAAQPEVAEARPVDAARLATLLRPWLGDAPGLPLPGMVEVRLRTLPAEPEALARRLEAALAGAVPGATVAAHGVWVARLTALARSVAAVALTALLLVAGVAAAVVAVAVRAGIAARREAIGVLHDLGATDRDIAGRFAGRVAWLCGAGAALGTAAAAPVLAGLADLGTPLLGGVPGGTWPWAGLPWAGLLALPVLAAALGWLTAQATVRRWLRRLP